MLFARYAARCSSTVASAVAVATVTSRHTRFPVLSSSSLLLQKRNAASSASEQQQQQQQQQQNFNPDTEVSDQMKDYATAHKKNRRGKKKKKGGGGVVKRPTPDVDKILANVFEEVMASRDRGEKVMEADVQQKAYEHTHEAVMGRKAFSKDDKWRQSLPREPLDDLRRLRPCTVRPVMDVSSTTGGRFVPPEDYRVGSDHEDADAAIAEKGEDGQKTTDNNNNADGSFLLLTDTVPVFLDAVDELAHWENELYGFLRDHPSRLRKNLPLLMEHYTVLAHRLKDAMLQFVATRNAVTKSQAVRKPAGSETAAEAVLPPAVMTQEHYTMSEKYLQFPRDTIVETGKSLSGTYDPTKFSKSVTGRLLKLDTDGYREWRQQRRAQQRSLTEAFSSLINT